MPRGGHFVETFRDTREATSLIFYLLIKGETSHWHRLSKNEILHFYDGDPMKVKTSSDGQKIKDLTLGKDFTEGQQYHWVVPAHTWFSMQSMGEWSLIGCTVSPAFTFDDFELARPEWSPGDDFC
ncbi:cupin domain-containing protein [Gammaproteobacteria bacterium]|nr:cupin domain-containing protein [Gammaproteobacteria bacterium]